MANRKQILSSFFAIWATLASAASHQPPKACAAQYCIPHVTTSWSQEESFTLFVKEFYVERNVTNAFATFIAEEYIQHNPFVGQGANAARAFLTPLFGNSSVKIEVLRTGFDNGLGWVHTRFDGYTALPTAIVDVYRWNGSCIQEHWDVIETLPENATNVLALF